MAGFKDKVLRRISKPDNDADDRNSSNAVSASSVKKWADRDANFRDNLRTTMSRAGWDQYEAYGRLTEYCIRNNLTSKRFIENKCWLDVKNQEADAIWNCIKTGEKPDKPYGRYDKKEIDDLLFTERQKKAAESLKQGQLTLNNVCEFFELSLPEKYDGIKDLPMKNFGFNARNIKPDGTGVFLCIDKKYLVPEMIKV